MHFQDSTIKIAIFNVPCAVEHDCVVAGTTLVTHHQDCRVLYQLASLFSLAPHYVLPRCCSHIVLPSGAHRFQWQRGGGVLRGRVSHDSHLTIPSVTCMKSTKGSFPEIKEL